MIEPVSLAELFARDPSEHTKADRMQIIKQMREDRHKFVVGGNKSAGAAPKLTEAQKKVSGLDLNIKL